MSSQLKWFLAHWHKPWCIPTWCQPMVLSNEYTCMSRITDLVITEINFWLCRIQHKTCIRLQKNTYRYRLRRNNTLTVSIIVSSEIGALFSSERTIDRSFRHCLIILASSDGCLFGCNFTSTMQMATLSTLQLNSDCIVDFNQLELLSTGAIRGVFSLIPAQVELILEFDFLFINSSSGWFIL